MDSWKFNAFSSLVSCCFICFKNIEENMKDTLETIRKIIKMKAIPKIVCSCGNIEICRNKSAEQIYSSFSEKHLSNCEKKIYGILK